MSKLVSVVIPCYNRENTIQRAVKSVLNQTYENIEVLVIDDGSVDASVKLAEDLGDSRIKIFKNDKNLGANYSRNKGIELAKGSIIAFQDSDDIWRPKKLEKCVEVLEEYGCDIVFHGMMKYGRNYKRYLPTYNLNEYQNKYGQLLIKNCASTQTMIGKRECFENVKFDERLRIHQDWDIMIRLAQKYDIRFIDEPLVDIYMQKDSITYLETSKSYNAIKAIYEKNEEYIQQDKNIKIVFMEALGKASERRGKSGKRYFKEALKIKKDIKIFFYYILSVFSLFPLYWRMKEILRKKISNYNLWKYIGRNK